MLGESVPVRVRTDKGTGVTKTTPVPLIRVVEITL